MLCRELGELIPFVFSETHVCEHDRRRVVVRPELQLAQTVFEIVDVEAGEETLLGEQPVEATLGPLSEKRAGEWLGLRFDPVRTAIASFGNGNAVVGR